MSYLPHSPDDVRAMLDVVGAESIDDLYDAIPEELRLDGEIDVPEALSEWEAVRLLRRLAGANGALVCFAGGGMYDHYVPAVVDQILRRSEFYTAYTPYQAEVAQGTLQAIYEFQTVVSELSGMDVANASIYDGATACAEAVLMAVSASRGRRRNVVVASTLHPHYRKVLETYNTGLELELRTAPHRNGRTDPGALAEAVDDGTAAVVVQSPNFFGILEEQAACAEAAHARGALLVSVFDPVASALVESPGEAGADIAVAEGQALGNAPSYGGPAVGLFACREDFVRSMPGRVAGATVDEDGRRAFVLTLQTREQHIRRERATSNICTNQALNALAALVHVATLGRRGMEEAAEVSLRKAHYAFDRLTAVDGVEPLFPDRPFFKEFALRTREPVESILRRGVARGILPGIDLARFVDGHLGVDDGLLVAVTEKRSREEIDELARILEEGAGTGAPGGNPAHEANEERSIAWRS